MCNVYNRHYLVSILCVMRFTNVKMHFRTGIVKTKSFDCVFNEFDLFCILPITAQLNAYMPLPAQGFRENSIA